ncbi:hypothetical protein GCM10009690_05130 [Brevibacterium permense]|uniref:Uncharacterized protein n=1 Tax=Brevibacterium permense TaxID=234834 RepID=A0ABN1ZV79_9MICO
MRFGGELIGDPVRVGPGDRIIGVTRGRFADAGFVSHDVTLPVGADTTGVRQFGDFRDTPGSVRSPEETKLNRISAMIERWRLSCSNSGVSAES